MNNIARATQDERKALFSNVSSRIGLSPGIVEKDFWVVWTLEYLFARSPWRKQLAFKGGTSLSKAFGKFYRCSWAHYELATAAEILLMPPEHALAALEADYRHMQNMIFGPRPPFSEILDTVRELESEIHGKGS